VSVFIALTQKVQVRKKKSKSREICEEKFSGRNERRSMTGKDGACGSMHKRFFCQTSQIREKGDRGTGGGDLCCQKESLFKKIGGEGGMGAKV